MKLLKWLVHALALIKDQTHINAFGWIRENSREDYVEYGPCWNFYLWKWKVKYLDFFLKCVSSFFQHELLDLATLPGHYLTMMTLEICFILKVSLQWSFGMLSCKVLGQRICASEGSGHVLVSFPISYWILVKEFWTNVWTLGVNLSIGRMYIVYIGRIWKRGICMLSNRLQLPLALAYALIAS